MRRIFDMAKSGEKPHCGTIRNLELDFLRLIYAVGYICVFYEPMRRSINNWIIRYETGNLINIILPVLDKSQSRQLEEENIRNHEGNKPGTKAEFASTIYGRDLAESALLQHIGEKKEGVVKSDV